MAQREESLNNPLIHFNGIAGDTGDYVLRPLPVRELGELLASLGPEPRPQIPRGLKFGLDPLDLANAGWGVVWARDVDPDIREALRPLLARRREQVGKKELFHELTYVPGETAVELWKRHGIGPGQLDPEKLPYYLLIVGSPSDIPFDVQYELGVPHAVGRLCLESSQAYAEHVEHLIRAETSDRRPRRTISFFGVRNGADELTRQSIEHLVEPLAERIARAQEDWRVETVLGPAADKGYLVRLLAGENAPDVLFTASHAARFKPDAPRRRSHQGALLCADWPGRKQWVGPIPNHHMFAAGDIAADARLDGLIAFHFACDTAGTPDIGPQTDRASKPDANPPSVALLPQRLLRRGALAVIGHVDIALAQSFLWYEAGSQIETFNGLLRAILSGQPVGHAMDHFSQRFAQLGTLVAGALPRRRDQEGEGDSVSLERVHLRAAYLDARSYIILGDPAARLNVASSLDDRRPAVR